MFQKDVESINFPLQNESIVSKGYIQSHDNKMEKMYVEDLAAIEPLSDDALLEELKNRLKLGDVYTFIGDVLVTVNPNRECPVYDRKVIKRAYFRLSLLTSYELPVPQSLHVQVAIR
jgi:myosin heavy subunit